MNLFNNENSNYFIFINSRVFLILFVVKIILLVTFLILSRSALPRVKIDKVVHLSWKKIIFFLITLFTIIFTDFTLVSLIFV